jgi:hypothetical protein
MTDSRSRFLRRGLVGTLVASALALGVQPASALTDEEVYRQLRFNRYSPGARAMGLGGAMIGMADDPGATFTNPAGIAFLDRPQVMIEYRGANWDDISFDRTGSFRLQGDQTEITNASGSVLYEEDALASVGFLGYVHPVNEFFAIGVSRHELLDFERDTSESYVSSTAFPPFEGSTPTAVREGGSSIGSLDALVDVWSVTLAWAPAEQISMGISLGAARLDVVQTVENFTNTYFDADNDTVMDTFLRPIDYRTHIDDDDIQFTFSAGLLWRPMETIGIGVVYHDGPEFEVIETIRQDGIRAKDVRLDLVGRGLSNAEGEFINQWAIPDSYGVGFSFGPYFEPRGGGGLVVNVDAVHVEYADLLDGYVRGLNAQMAGPQGLLANVIVEDATEFHFGIGYSWTVGYNNSIHLRAGAYTDDDHSLITAGRIGTGIGAQSGREDTVHGTLGTGFTLKRGFYSFELDAAADVSDVGEQYFGSALFKF